jgi:arabinofuranosyltransferase
MEVGLYTVLVLLTVFLYFRGLSRGVFHPVFPAVLFLVSITRADGILLVIATVAHYAFFRHATGVKAGLSWIWAAFLPYAAYLLAKAAYYHSLLPNTFYAKVNSGGGFFLRGLLYFMAFAMTNMVFVLYCLQSRLREIKNTWFNLYIMALLSCFAGVYVLIGGDHMPGRLLVPFFFLFSMMIAPALGGWITGNAAKRKFFIASVILINLALNLTYNGSWFLWKRDIEAERNCVGLWLNEHLDKNATIAVVEAGIIPYYSGLRTIDMCGLNDYGLARMQNASDASKTAPGHDRCNLGYGLAGSPDFVSYFGYNITQYDGRYGPVVINCGGNEVILYLKNTTKYV